MNKENVMDRTERFSEDLELLVSKLSPDMHEEARESLGRLRDRLIELHRSNVVKINHSVMELVCAKQLILKGYEVRVEYQLDGALTCDLYGTKGDGSLVLEVETGFIPPEHALDPSTYLFARIASKITRYSSYAGKFALGVPPHYVLPIPKILLMPPRDRTSEELYILKNMCDLYYRSPPVTLDEVRNARLHTVYLIDVDNAAVQEVDPETYIKKPYEVS